MLKRFRGVLLIGLTCFALLALVEGSASLLLLSYKLYADAPNIFTDRLFTVYDEEIGWISAPNLNFQSMFARNIGLTTNSLRFRNRQEFTVAVPPGKLRIFCSGDSFTQGYGVGNSETWCDLLAQQDPRLETVNLGLGGYGVDQMYLWYKRNAGVLDHNLIVLAVIGNDFQRVMLSRFLGYYKPLLELRDGRVSVSNKPVPPTPRLPSWMQAARTLTKDQRSFELLQVLKRRVGVRSQSVGAMPETEARQIISAILDDLQTIAHQRRAGLVLLYQPMYEECDGIEMFMNWRTFWNEEAVRRKLPHLDLTDACRSLPEDEWPKLFIQDTTNYYYSNIKGHYGVQGHRLVARHLLPLVQSALGVR